MSFGFAGMASISFTLVVDAYPKVFHRRASLSPLTTLADRRKIIAHGFIAVAFFRNVFAVVGPAATNPWIKGMGLGGMFISAAVINMAVNLLAVPLIIWGKTVRTRTASRYHRLARHT